MDVKKRLVEVLDDLIRPIRDRRAAVSEGDALDALKSGTTRANEVAETTLAMAKKAMKQDYFGRKLSLVNL